MRKPCENLEKGGRLWLDLDYSAEKEQVNVLCVGDSITQGSNSSYGNWRTGLMKKLAAAGYAPMAKGHLTIESLDICGATMPDEWIHHAGIGGQRLVTRNGGGTIDNIEATLDQAGDVDFVLVKLCTNDISSNGSTAEELYPVWEELVWKVLDQKPHAKFIAGAVVDIANATKNAQVIAYNAMVSNAIASATFPAKRVYFADLYTPCYRYDADGIYITGSFKSATDLHPDWPGEDKMADVYCAAILNAIADDTDFELGAADTTVPTTSGCENNVPAEFRNGFIHARTLDIAAKNGIILSDIGTVPYSYVNEEAPAENISRVGYYVELKRRNDAQSDFHGLTRWLWVSMDAFGGKTIEDVGVPLTTHNQRVVRRLRVKTNMPGIESTAADAVGVKGWIEFWPSSYGDAASGVDGAPANLYGFDWNDTDGGNTFGYGSMQVYRVTPDGRNPAQTMFAFNHWTVAGSWEIGLGNFSHQRLGSMDWTFTGETAESMTATMSADAYEVAKIEVWTSSLADDPDPSDAALVYLDTVIDNGDEATVRGTMVDLGGNSTNATVTLEWSTDPTFATVAGSSSAGVVSATGEFEGTATGLTAGQTWYFRFTAVNSNDKSSQSDATDGIAFVAGYWRPQTSADVWTSVAWLKDGTGSPVAFNPAWAAVFDGTESTKTATVQIPEAVAASRVLVQGSESYTFNGAGSIAARRLDKEGSGTLVLEAGVLANTPDIVVKEGVVKLGDNATAGAAGSNGGTITVKNGGQFDLNYIDTASGAGHARANITSGKTFVIEGAGPDGSGALTTTHESTYWGSPIGKLILTDDATIGGVGRTDIHYEVNGSVTGPDDATLTVANQSPDDFGLGIVNVPLSVGRIVVSEQGKLWTYGNSGLKLDVPNGIDVYGLFRLWESDGSWNVGGIRAHGAKARIGNNSSTSYVKASVTVTPGATLTLDGSASTHYINTITNAGTIAISSGKHYIYGDLVNEGDSLITLASSSYIYPNTVTGDSRFAATANMMWTSGRTDWGDYALDVALSGGGSFVIGTNDDGYGLPNFAPGKLNMTAASGHSGTVHYHPSVSTSINGPVITGPLNNFLAQGPNTGAVISSMNSNVVFSATQFTTGTGSGRGDHTFVGADTDIFAKTVQVGNRGDKSYTGFLDFTEGLLRVGSGGITTSWRQPMRPLFLMSGGTLRADANFAITQPGMTIDFGSPMSEGDVTIDLNGKTVKWGTGLNGNSDVTITGAGTFSTDRPGIQGIPTGKWTINSTGSIDLRNAAGFAGGLSLAENASATLDIAGTNLVELGFWTWHDNAWNVMNPLFTAGSSIASHVATSLTYFNRAASKITDVMHGKGTGINYYGEFYVSAEQAGTWYFAYRSQTHFGVFIDNTQLSTSGPNKGNVAKISLTEGWHKFMISAYADSSAYADATDPTIGPTDYADAENVSIWFKVGGEQGSWPAEYTVFDVTTVPLRMRSEETAKTSVRWRKYTNAANNLGVYANCGEHLFKDKDSITNSIRVIHTLYSTGSSAPLGGCVSRFDGYFYVSPEREGQWTFTGKFDDQIALDVDGRRLFAATANGQQNSANIVLTEGWHKFDIRTGDNSTASGSGKGGSGGSLTDSQSNNCALMFSVAGGSNYSFDERYVPISYSAGIAQKHEKPGLGGEIELAAGSTLVNAPLEGGWCPIYGTLKGTGTLSGPYRFTGEDNCWEVSNAGDDQQMSAATFAELDDDTLAGLRSFKATFPSKPFRSMYVVSAANDLTREAAAAVPLTVVDEAGNDYTDNFTLDVSDGKLVLRNARPLGTILVIK